MAYFEGHSLAERIKDGPLPQKEVALYAKKVAEAIAFAHEKGVIHRDLKPSNILLDSNDEPRVTDFGLAKRIESDSGLTATGQILGTASFMPPEQAAGKAEEVTRIVRRVFTGSDDLCAGDGPASFSSGQFDRDPQASEWIKHPSARGTSIPQSIRTYKRSA